MQNLIIEEISKQFRETFVRNNTGAVNSELRYRDRSGELLQLFPVILVEDPMHFSVAWSKPLTSCFGNTFLNLNSEGRDTCSPLSYLKQLLYLHRPYEKLTLRGLFVWIARYFRNADSFYQAEGVHTGASCHQIRRRRT